MQLALVDTGHRQRKPILAPLGGRVDKVMARIGAPIVKGEPLCTIAPGPQQVFESLRALAIVGGAEDLESVRQQFDPDHRFSPAERAHVEAQARLTAAAIQRREERSDSLARVAIPAQSTNPATP